MKLNSFLGVINFTGVREAELKECPVNMVAHVFFKKVNKHLEEVLNDQKDLRI